MEFDMKTKLIRLALAMGTVFFAGAAAAAEDTSSIDVSASIAAACSVGNGTAIAFGSLDMITGDGTQSTADDVETTTFPAICTTGTTIPTFKYASTNGGGTGFALLHGGSAETIAYTLHQDSTGTLAAVSHNTDAAHPDFVVDGTSRSLPVAVKVTPAQKAEKPVGTYEDVITVTVTFEED
jgi:spore coat protein U-like protein